MKKQQNSIETILRFLNANPYRSENEIMESCFGYRRNCSWESNKKYADMLRRGMRNGKIGRTKANVKDNNATYFYYTNDTNVHLFDVRECKSASTTPNPKTTPNTTPQNPFMKFVNEYICEVGFDNIKERLIVITTEKCVGWKKDMLSDIHNESRDDSNVDRAIRDVQSSLDIINVYASHTDYTLKQIRNANNIDDLILICSEDGIGNVWMECEDEMIREIFNQTI